MFYNHIRTHSFLIIDLLFINKRIPEIEILSSSYMREKFINTVVIHTIDYYYEQLKHYIQNEYAPEFTNLIHEERWNQITVNEISQRSDKTIVQDYVNAVEY